MSPIPYNGDGGYLSKDDIIKGMAAEIEMLKNELNISNQMKFTYMDDCTKMIAENDRLKAEVERIKTEKDQAECDYDNCQRRKVSIDNHRFDLFTENKTLKAEVERLRIAGGESEPRFVFLSDYRHLKAERDTLKAEVERLIKAGDAMAETLESAGFDSANDFWNAAKEGKPSV